MPRGVQFRWEPGGRTRGRTKHQCSTSSGPCHHSTSVAAAEGPGSGGVRRPGSQRPTSAPRCVHPRLPGTRVFDPLRKDRGPCPRHGETLHGPRGAIGIVQLHPERRGTHRLGDVALGGTELERRDIPVRAGWDAVPPRSFCHATRVCRRSDTLAGTGTARRGVARAGDVRAACARGTTPVDRQPVRHGHGSCRRRTGRAAWAGGRRSVRSRRGRAGRIRAAAGV